jgi:formylglycine-generating enzyme required for sulfatase activity
MTVKIKTIGYIIIVALILSACGAGLGKRVALIEGVDKYDVMVLIPAGKFIMGSDPEDEKRGVIVGLNELPQRRVMLNAYYIDMYEVTNDRYQRFIDATENKVPFDYKDGKYPEGEGYWPVSHLDWFDAKAYCEWTGKRLPTEAEWEKAARGTDGRIYPWGDEFDAKKLNTNEWNKRKIERVDVGSFPEGASPYGLEDMGGNVWEWTENWYEPYPGGGDKKDWASLGTTFKVIRGGAWNGSGYDLARTNGRFPYRPEKSYHCFIGVRCVKDIK